jgi:hypothetical protein
MGFYGVKRTGAEVSRESNTIDNIPKLLSDQFFVPGRREIFDLGLRKPPDKGRTNKPGSSKNVATFEFRNQDKFGLFR